MKSVLLGTLLLVMTLAGARAQVAPVDTTTGKPYYILLNDGSHLFGRIVRSDSIMHTVRMRNGQLTYVERTLFKAISGVAPVSADSTVYYSNNARPAPVLSTTTAPGQYVITLQDGTVLKGRVLSQDTSRVVIETQNLGLVHVPVGQVVRMDRIGLDQRRYLRNGHPAEGYRNLFPHYMNLTPTAFQAERGRVYYRNSSLTVNQVDVGITDNWSLALGVAVPIPVPFVLAGWLGTKVSVPIGSNVRVGAQGQYYLGGFTLFSAETFRASYVQGIVSLGSSQNNVTFGLGGSLDRDASATILTVGVVRKVGPLVTFISENSVYLGQNSNTPVKLSAGVRFDRERHSFDLSGNLFFGLSSGRNSGFGFTPLASYQLRIGQ